MSFTSPRTPSLLSEFSFLQKLTRWKTLNNALIDILEGQLITLGIAVAFILIFLIREWVVQQQPIINMGVAAAAAAEVGGANAQPPGEANQPAAGIEPEIEAHEDQEPRPFYVEASQQTESPGEDTILGTDTASITNDEETDLPTGVQSLEHEIIDRLISEEDLSAEGSALTESVATALKDDSTGTSDSPQGEAVGVPYPPRPPMPRKELMAQATDIARKLEEESAASGQKWPGVDIFMDFWNRADGNPAEVLNLIEKDGRTNELSWIVSAMHRLQKSGGRDPHEEFNLADIQTLEESNQEEKSERSSDGWQVLEDTGTSISPRANSQPQDETSDHSSFDLPGLELSDSIPADITNTSGEAHVSPPQIADDEVQMTAAEFLQSEASMPTQEEKHEAETFSETIKNWLWGDVPQAEAIPEEREDDDEHIVENIAEEAPFVPVQQGLLRLQGEEENANGLQPDPEVARAAAEAGIDPNEVEQVEDGEDLEGVMELIGMQGPLAGLLQNGMFSTVLISMTVFFGIWVPYIAGKVMLVFMANPVSLLIKMPLRWASTTADIVVDTILFILSCAFYWIDRFVRLTAAPLGWFLPFVHMAQLDEAIPRMAYRMTWTAAERISKNFDASRSHFSDSDIPVFSVVAHEALKKMESHLVSIARLIFHFIKTVAESPSPGTLILSHVKVLLLLLGAKISSILTSLLATSSITAPKVSDILNLEYFRINLDIPARTEPLDYSLSKWSTQDRIIAIILGYTLFSALGAAYLKSRNLFRQTQEEDRPADGVLVDILHQAGGVLKVILIITIEMIVFPLYCGLLLDVALLPLFDKSSIVSRLTFTADYPSTSLFVHWFAGTCYMFHFALFVSMCRKIMRSGVLYFIRDPDDPSFHPVRDVLERSVSTQLRKILFSALVYGALVIVCLGAVVWGLSSLFSSVFPIHWSSNEPVLEFPVDLLVFNFLMPLVIKMFKPSVGLQNMYKWWFRRCARLLRLTHFLFGERMEEEEGRHTWLYSKPRDNEGSIDANEKPQNPKKHAFIRDGRLVRAPASDQVRIPKGSKTFVDIDEEGNRLDGLPDAAHGLHGRENRMFSEIYIPPFFRLRIAGFIVLIWLFAATTGVSLTVVPLLLGRFVFSYLFPSHPRMNDMYAFAIGVYLLGGPVYLAIMYRAQLLTACGRISTNTLLQAETVKRATLRAGALILRGLKLLYFYGAFGLFLPSLFALIYEAYVLIPLHTYFSRADDTPSVHTIHFISDWTLGVLYVRGGLRIMLRFHNSRPSRALRALVSPQNNGASWLNPDIRLATRAILLPITVLVILALFVPTGLGWVANRIWFTGATGASQALVYRYSYPALLVMILAYAFGKVLRRAVTRWRARIRDEVYLIGERLHNLGETKPKAASS